jgi:hypothetical protein
MNHTDEVQAAACCAARAGTCESSGPSPSAKVGWVKTASPAAYKAGPSIAVYITAMTSPASGPIMVKPRMRSSVSWLTLWG